jgi:hypothetical protein
MKKSNAALSILPLLLSTLLAGCGKDVFFPYNPAPITPSTTGTGNWSFESFIAGPGGANYAFGGSLIDSGGALSGVLHIDQSCFGLYATDVPYTGTLDSENNITINSSPVDGQVLSVQGTLSADAFTINHLTFSVNGSCSGNIVGTTDPFVLEAGFQVPSLTGTWMGSGASLGLDGVTITEQLTQSPTPDAHGDYALTGTITVAGISCFSTGTMQPPSFVTGATGHQRFLMDDGSVLDGTLSVVLQHPEQLRVKPRIGLFPATISGGRCNKPVDLLLN